MNRTKLNIRIHNPNTEEETVKHIIGIFVDVGVRKLKEEVENTVKQMDYSKEHKISVV